MSDSAFSFAFRLATGAPRFTAITLDTSECNKTAVTVFAVVSGLFNLTEFQLHRRRATKDRYRYAHA